VTRLANSNRQSFTSVKHNAPSPGPFTDPSGHDSIAPAPCDENVLPTRYHRANADGPELPSRNREWRQSHNVEIIAEAWIVGLIFRAKPDIPPKVPGKLNADALGFGINGWNRSPVCIAVSVLPNQHGRSPLNPFADFLPVVTCLPIGFNPCRHISCPTYHRDGWTFSALHSSIYLNVPISVPQIMA